MKTWGEVTAEARRLYSEKYHITVQGEHFRMDGMFSDISVVVTKVPEKTEINVTFNCWRDAAGIEDFLVWIDENGYVCNCTVIRPTNK